ncbi:hypothetical protein [Arthrospiribacter ruber]|uniref:Phage protein n=1 Tax=Arthrospiribacter ruber TaxID=2487934 RepID=A0A951MC74_9BACT|nr:hypothetical protein [Arthrospiribacter ruber]MBW3469076.1 hypothetical protein [Arthrospiribacter ruber]
MVQYIQLNDKDYPVRINRRVMVAFEAKTGKGLNSLSNLSTQNLTDILFAGIREGYAFTKEKNPFKDIEDFEKILDEIELEEFYEKSANVIAGFFSKKEEKE